jgi:GMP synthase (glutamine-hydrolysing)
MKVLVVQHDADKPLGRLEEPLLAGGLELDVRLAGRDRVALGDHAAIIGLSGFADPVDETEAVHATRAAFREALDSARPALGICLGAQLLGQAAGAAAAGCDSEYGFAPISLTAAAAHDALLAGIPEQIEVFHAHDYAVDLPPGATPLANTVAALQAFHLPPVAWGFQFHPEPTLEIVDAWVATHHGVLRGKGADPDRVAADSRRFDRDARMLAEAIAGGFARVVRGTTDAPTTSS